MGTGNRLSAVTVKVTDLIDVVQNNLRDHGSEYDAAVQGFRREALKALESRIDELVSSAVVSLHFSLPVPEDHTADYERVLKMLTMTKDAGQEFIELDQAEQEMYVMDEWGWKSRFSETSTFYGGGR